jgi:hypothetical protein
MRRKPESLYLNPENGIANIFSLKYAFPTVSKKMFYGIIITQYILQHFF